MHRKILVEEPRRDPPRQSLGAVADTRDIAADIAMADGGGEGEVMQMRQIGGAAGRAFLELKRRSKVGEINKFFQIHAR